jgi:hypothetical protein
MGVVAQYGYNSRGDFPKRVSPEVKTKHYNTWIDVMRRVYNEEWENKHETYKGVGLCDEWHDFQSFAKWFDENYQEGFQIDKDILSDYYGEGVYYSPKTCRMIPRDLNMLLVNRVGKSRNRKLPLGVSRAVGQEKYTAWCNDGDGKTVNLGGSICEKEAFGFYKAYKENLIKRKARMYLEVGVIDTVMFEALNTYQVLPY